MPGLVTGFEIPEALALSGNILYIADVEANTVGVYDATTGAPINRSFLTGLQRPSALAISGNDLYVVNEDSNSVAEYNATTGAVINATLISGLADPTSIAVGIPEPKTWAIVALCFLLTAISRAMRFLRQA